MYAPSNLNLQRLKELEIYAIVSQAKKFVRRIIENNTAHGTNVLIEVIGLLKVLEEILTAPPLLANIAKLMESRKYSKVNSKVADMETQNKTVADVEEDNTLKTLKSIINSIQMLLLTNVLTRKKINTIDVSLSIVKVLVMISLHVTTRLMVTVYNNVVLRKSLLTRISS